MLKLRDVKGVGDATLKKLKELGIETVFGLLSFFPSKHIDLGSAMPICDAEPGQFGLFEGIVTDVKTPSLRSKRGFQVTLRDTLSAAHGGFKIMFFNQPYLNSVFTKDSSFRIFAKFPYNSGADTVFVNPVFERTDKISKLEGIYTLYPLKGIVSQGIFKKIVRAAIDAIRPDEFTEKTSEVNRAIFDSFKKIHFPFDISEAENAKKTLSALDLAITLSIHKKLRSVDKQSKVLYKNLNNIILKYKDAQSFELTSSQCSAIQAISTDLENRKTSRIILGDVGSGKTAVGFFALCAAASGGYQGAMIAPTEILARQHYANFLQTASEFNIDCALLVGGLKQSEKKSIIRGIESGEIQIIFGTQALISDDVNYKNLALAVIDEQHRFGVSERSALERKGAEYVLSMTATPIPRSLALTFYDNLPVSDVYKRAEASTNVATQVIFEDKVDETLKYIVEECSKGNQSFIICPAIQDSEGFEVYSLETLVNKYCRMFKNSDVSVLYGKMRAEEKNTVMKDFSSGKTQLLLSTTVVEVGVDTLAKNMVIMNADRFGLAALHQLRGRIGRDGSPAVCVLHTSTRNETAVARLRYLQNAASGQEIAEYDFYMRGAGDFIGTKQSGATVTPIFGLPVSADILKSAKKTAENLTDKFDVCDLLALTRGNRDRIYAFLENIKNATLNS